MRRLILGALLATAVAAPAASPASARDSQSGTRLANAGQKVNGASAGEWLGRWWQAVLETPSPQERYPGCVTLGRRTVGVVFPPVGGEASCVVPKGSTLALVVDTAACSDFEEPPFYGATPDERRECAIRTDQGAEVHEVIVDGVRVRLTDDYRAQSPDIGATLPADNLLGAPAGTSIRFGADGWLAFTKPLTSGPHEIVVHASGTFDGEPYDSTGLLHVEVTGHGHGNG